MARRTTRRRHRKTTRRAVHANVRRKMVDGSWLRSLPSAVVYRFMKPQIIVVGSGNAYANVQGDKWVPIEPPGIAYFAIYASRWYDQDRRHPKVRKFIEDALEVHLARPSHEETRERDREGRAQFDPMEYMRPNVGDAPYGYDPRQRPLWTPDEAWEMFDRWWQRDGHAIYSSREQAVEMWRTNGIRNLPQYPGGHVRRNGRYTKRPPPVSSMRSGLPQYDERYGWHGGDSRALYAWTDTRTGRVIVGPTFAAHGMGPEMTVRLATREEADEDGWPPGWKLSENSRQRTTYRRMRSNRSVVTRGKIELVERRLSRVINGDSVGAAGAIDEARSTLSDLEAMPGDEHRSQKRLLLELIMEASSSMQPNRIPPIPSDKNDIAAWDDWHRRTYAVGTPVKFLEDYQSVPDRTGAYDVVPKDARAVVSREYDKDYVKVTVKITDARDKIGYRIDDLIGREIKVGDHEIREFLQPLEDNWTRQATPIRHYELPTSQKHRYKPNARRRTTRRS